MCLRQSSDHALQSGSNSLMHLSRVESSSDVINDIVDIHLSAFRPSIILNYSAMFATFKVFLDMIDDEFGSDFKVWCFFL